MDRRMLIPIVLAVAFSAGITAAYVSTPSGDKCKDIEQKFENNESFTGTMSCYPPGVIDVDVSKEVEQNSELGCVCRGVWGGEIHVFPISFSD